MLKSFFFVFFQQKIFHFLTNNISMKLFPQNPSIKILNNFASLCFFALAYFGGRGPKAFYNSILTPKEHPQHQLYFKKPSTLMMNNLPFYTFIWAFLVAKSQKKFHKGIFAHRELTQQKMSYTKNPSISMVNNFALYIFVWTLYGCQKSTRSTLSQKYHLPKLSQLKVDSISFLYRPFWGLPRFL